MRITLASAALAILTTSAAGQTVEFFYTNTVNLCSFNKNSIPANQETTHGGVCAYRTDTGRIYACPAPDPTCWTYYQGCVNGASGQQTICNENGATWCCSADETCTTTVGQINVCVSNFTSPNSGVSIDVANQKYLAALGVSNVTATSQSVDPTPFSTRQLAKSTSTSTSSTTSSTSSSTTSTSSAISSSTTSSASASASSTSGAAAASGSSSSSGISGGAIGGIVVGVIALLAIVGAGFFYLGRKKRNQKQIHETSHPYASEVHSAAPTYYSGFGSGPAPGELHNEKKTGAYNGNRPNELGTEGHSRVEMAGSDWRSPAVRHEMA